MVNQVFWREIKDGVRLVWRASGIGGAFESVLGQVGGGFGRAKDGWRVGGMTESLTGHWNEIGFATSVEEGKAMLVAAIRAGTVIDRTTSLKEAEWNLGKIVGLPGKRKV
jgi:hypothetical protein